LRFPSLDSLCQNLYETVITVPVSREGKKKHFFRFLALPSFLKYEFFIFSIDSRGQILDVLYSITHVKIYKKTFAIFPNSRERKIGFFLDFCGFHHFFFFFLFSQLTFALFFIRFLMSESEERHLLDFLTRESGKVIFFLDFWRHFCSVNFYFLS
jgi:hypothetical protein